MKASFFLFDYVCCLHLYLKQNNKIFVQMFKCAVALWKSWVYKYTIIFQVIKLKTLCETLKNKTWKILAWYPNKMWWYHQRNPKCSNWRWTDSQMQVALVRYQVYIFLSEVHLEEKEEYKNYLGITPKYFNKLFVLVKDNITK